MNDINPFRKYPGKGRKILGTLKGSNSRHDYARQVAPHSGYKCAYCDRNLRDSYESWLDLQVDHVIPRCAINQGFKEKWIEDISNCVICCAACNSFLNRYPIKEKTPKSEADFFDIRDKVFAGKRKHAQKRHRDEREFFRKTFLNIYH